MVILNLPLFFSLPIAIDFLVRAGSKFSLLCKESTACLLPIQVKMRVGINISSYNLINKPAFIDKCHTADY
ncbi:MAG: hypothetical protein K9M19_07210, partial [Candidatus Marinimicrobia bacterium]|nr:hypothetical protein [Candidatus Neomarinimicrobiota bacterium]